MLKQISSIRLIAYPPFQKIPKVPTSSLYVPGIPPLNDFSSFNKSICDPEEQLSPCIMYVPVLLQLLRKFNTIDQLLNLLVIMFYSTRSQHLCFHTFPKTQSLPVNSTHLGVRSIPWGISIPCISHPNFSGIKYSGSLNNWYAYFHLAPKTESYFVITLHPLSFDDGFNRIHMYFIMLLYHTHDM